MIKRKKSSRMRGSHTHGRGGMKRARGSGHRGGFGMAGTGKRADQKKTKINNMSKKYFGKAGLNPKPKRLKVINIKDLENFKEKDIELKGYKLLSKGDCSKAINVKVDSASKSAIEKIEKAGGKVELKESDEKDLPEKVESQDK